MAHLKYISFLVLAACLLAGCKTTKVTTKTELETHTEVVTDSASVAVHSDSTGVDMNKQHSVIDKLKTSGQVEIDEIIETITTAATDSTPATTTTKTTRHIKAGVEQEQEREVNTSQEVHVSEVESDSSAVSYHFEEKNQQKSEEKTTEKSGSHASRWDMRLFCLVVILVIGYVMFDFKGKR